MTSEKTVGWVTLCGLAILSLSPGAALTGGGGAGAAAPFVDASTEIPWWAAWDRDGDGDLIDDAILRLAAHDEVPTDDVLPRYAVHKTAESLRFSVFVRFADAPSPADVEAVAATTGGTVRPYAWAELVYAPDVSLAAVRALAALPGVRGVELERTVVPTMQQAIPALLVNNSFAFGQGARERWKVDGTGIGIAFIDTGIDEEHESYDPAGFLGGYDATLPIRTLNGDVLDLPATTYNERNPDDDIYPAHGTHVASLVVANDPNETHIGVAPAASYLDVKVILNGGIERFGTGSTPYGIGSMVIEGLDFVLRHNAGESHIGQPNVTVRVVSMSISETAPDRNGTSVLSHAVNRVVDRGLSVVAAAGNCGAAGGQACCDNGVLLDDCTERRGNNTVPAPGAARRAITVAALDGADTIEWSDDFVAGFSSRGPNGGEPKPNVAAYGVDIEGAKGDPRRDGRAGWEYHRLSGTSMATPLVAGVAVLMYQANATLDPDEVKRLIEATARDVGEHDWDPETGAGAVNAYFAVGAALGILDPETTIIDLFGHDVPRLKVPIPSSTPTPTPTKTVIRNRAPEVGIAFGPVAPQPGEPIVFASQTSDPEGHKLVSYAWDMGDGTTKKGDRFAYTYDKAGTYKVRLTVTDEKGMAGSAYTMVTVGDPAKETGEAAALPAMLVLLSLLVMMGVLRRRR